MSLTQISEGMLGMVIPAYPSDLNEAEWALLAPLIPAAKPGGRRRSSDMRRISNGFFYVLRTGCTWRYLPREHGASSDRASCNRVPEPDPKRHAVPDVPPDAPAVSR